MNDNDLHPIRFTNKQVRLIKHIMGYFTIASLEGELEELLRIIKDSEEEKTRKGYKL